MLRIRVVEERIAAIYHPADEMKCPTHLYTGQEAVAAGVCEALRQDDVVCPSHRSHGWYLAKGGDLGKMMAELFGKVTGCSKGWGGSMHLVAVDRGIMGSSSILGGTISHAAGCALAFKMLGTDRVAVAAFGDATVEEGIFHESLNWASLKRLPVVFVCENNLFSTHTPLSLRQPPVEIFRRAESYGLPGIRVDGNDAIEMYRVAEQAVAIARSGGGPTLIEAMTYRWREHVGPDYDHDLGYRTRKELDQWMERCPIQRLSHLVSKDELANLEARLGEELDEAIDFARRSSFPDPEVLYDVR